MTPSSTTSPGPQVRLTPAMSQQPTPGEVRGGPQLAQDRPVSRLRIDTRTYWNQWLKTLEPPVAATPGGSRLNPLQTGSDVKAPPGGGRIWCDNYSPDWGSLCPEPSQCPELLIESQMAYDCRDVLRQMERDGVQVLKPLTLHTPKVGAADDMAVWSMVYRPVSDELLIHMWAGSQTLLHFSNVMRDAMPQPPRVLDGKAGPARRNLVDDLPLYRDRLALVEVAPIPAGQIAPDTVRFDALCPITGT